MGPSHQQPPDRRHMKDPVTQRLKAFYILCQGRSTQDHDHDYRDQLAPTRIHKDNGICHPG